MGEHTHAPKPRRRIIDEHIEGDHPVVVTYSTTVLQGGGDTTHVPPVAVAAAETNAAREVIDQLIRALRPLIGTEHAIALEAAATELEVAVRTELDARVIAALFHDSPAANTMILFQRTAGAAAGEEAGHAAP